MQKFSSLKPLHESFLEQPSQQRLMLLQKETEKIMKSNPETKAQSYQLACNWWMLSQAGNEQAELRYKTLLKQAVATTPNKLLKEKIFLMFGRPCRS